jgi:hypothetical protein
MTGNAWKCFITAVVMAGAIAGVPAQSRDRIAFTAPFTFHVGERQLPAGAYTIEFSPIAPAILTVQDAFRVPRATVVGIPSYSARPLIEATLIFNRYEDRYFLSSIWMPGRTTGEELIKSPMELDLAKTTAPVTVTLVRRSDRASTRK